MINVIKDYAKKCGVKLWQVAEAMGMQDSNFSKLLRHPLTQEQEFKICCVIDKLAMEAFRGNYDKLLKHPLTEAHKDEICAVINKLTTKTMEGQYDTLLKHPLKEEQKNAICFFIDDLAFIDQEKEAYYE